MIQDSAEFLFRTDLANGYFFKKKHKTGEKMASGMFAILKNISMLMDDTVTMSKVAIKDTVGVLGDDLAVNAEKASKFSPSRELPVLLKIIKGSLFNKLLLVPILIFISYIFPYLIAPILILGATFLSYEGVEGLREILGKKHEENRDEGDEDEKVKSAINTDKILSIEIIVIAWNAVTGKPIVEQFIIVSLVALLATVGVYGIVGLIVRFDDMGLWLIKHSVQEETKIVLKHKIEPKEKMYIKKTITHVNMQKMYLGSLMIRSMNLTIKSLTYIGVVAMFVVAGEILIHKINFLYTHINVDTFFSFIPAITLSIIIGYIAIVLINIFDLKSKASKSE